MTQQQLQDKIINLEKYIGKPNSVVTEGLLSLINQHTLEVIGEDDKENGDTLNITGWMERNNLKAEQRERAGLEK